MKKVLIFSAPSGAGKTTLVRHLLDQFSNLEFSISATSRQPRGAEIDGRDYYFLSAEDFEQRVERGEFIEWEEVYTETYYGTLRSEIERIWDKGNVAVFDVDVVGGVNIKRLFGDSALSVFVMPPSVDELRVRLLNRSTDSLAEIDKRVAKAALEIEYAAKFDRVIINDQLSEAQRQAELEVAKFLA